MGLFSSKTRIDVDVVTQPLIEEKANFIQQGVVSGTLSGSGPVAGIRSQIFNGLSSNVDSFFRYCRRNPLIGLPQGNMIRDGVEISELDTLVEQALGVPVTIDYGYISTVSADMFGLLYLQSEYGINITSGVLEKPINTSITGTQVYLSAEYISTTELKIFYEIRASTSTAAYDVTVTYPINQEAVYYYVFYLLDSDPSKKYLFIQEKSSDLSEVPSTLQDIDYLPVLPIKQNEKSILETASPEKLKKYERACDLLGFSFKETVESILESTAENDPSQMKDIFFQFAIDIHTKVKDANLYLYEYFDYLRETQVTDKNEFLTWLNTQRLIKDPPTNIVRVTQGNYDANLLFNYIEISIEEDTKDLKLGEVHKEFVVKEPIKPSTLDFWINIGYDVEQSEMILRKKINETQVQKILISGLTHVHTVLDNRVVIRTIANSLDEANTKDDDKSFYIPISLEAAKRLNPLKRANLYQEAISITVYTVVRTKVKWYERGAFKIVLAIVMIIIAIYSGYVDFTSWAALFSSLAYLAATTLVFRIVILPILVKVVEIIGVDAATVIAILLAVAAAVTGNATTAANLLEMAQWTFQAVTEVAGNIIEEFARELEKLFDAFKDFQDELDEINDALGKGNNNYLLDAIKGFYFDPNETPDMFFYRTIHETNPGVRIFEFVEKFTSYKLELPQVKHDFKYTQLRGE